MPDAMTRAGRASMSERQATIRDHFPSALAVDDMMARVEMALAAFGFRGDNSIGGWIGAVQPQCRV